jgi:hypothetical protein
MVRGKSAISQISKALIIITFGSFLIKPGIRNLTRLRRHRPEASQIFTTGQAFKKSAKRKASRKEMNMFEYFTAKS